MLSDRFLPEYDFIETHEILINASATHIYSKLRTLNLGQSAVISWLLRLRGFRIPFFSIAEFERFGFATLAEVPNEEWLMGLVGQFWRPTGNMQAISAENFAQFQRRGFAKSVWSFHLSSASGNRTLVTTETRVLCLDGNSRRWFRLYWLLIAPFSAWIRRAMLQLLKEESES